jgi:hypothetical protein
MAEPETQAAPLVVALGDEMAKIPEGGRLNPTSFMGKQRILVATVTPTADLAAATVVILASLPQGALILPGGRIFAVNGTGPGSVTLGTYRRNPSSREFEAVDDDAFGTLTVDGTGANLAMQPDQGALTITAEDAFLGMACPGGYPADGSSVKVYVPFVLD